MDTPERFREVFKAEAERMAKVMGAAFEEFAREHPAVVAKAGRPLAFALWSDGFACGGEYELVRGRLEAFGQEDR